MPEDTIYLTHMRPIVAAFTGDHQGHTPMHAHTVHLALGALLIPCTVCGTGDHPLYPGDDVRFVPAEHGNCSSADDPDPPGVIRGTTLDEARTVPLMAARSALPTPCTFH